MAVVEMVALDRLGLVPSRLTPHPALFSTPRLAPRLRCDGPKRCCCTIVSYQFSVLQIVFPPEPISLTENWYQSFAIGISSHQHAPQNRTFFSGFSSRLPT